MDMNIYIVPAVIIVAILLWIIWNNTVIRLCNGVEFAMGAIDALLMRRFDLIPNLVAVCEKYAAHEREVFTLLAELRSVGRGSREDRQALRVQRLPTGATLSRLLAWAEAQPQLRSVETFVNLQRALGVVEADLAAARRAYNAAVYALNNACETIPLKYAARAQNIQRQAMLEADAAQREPVKVWRS